MELANKAQAANIFSQLAWETWENLHGKILYIHRIGWIMQNFLNQAYFSEWAQKLLVTIFRPVLQWWEYGVSRKVAESYWTKDIGQCTGLTLPLIVCLTTTYFTLRQCQFLLQYCNLPAYPAGRPHSTAGILQCLECPISHWAIQTYKQASCERVWIHWCQNRLMAYVLSRIYVAGRHRRHSVWDKTKFLTVPVVLVGLSWLLCLMASIHIFLYPCSYFL